jgi:UDP-N-acetylglucosamine diphosphorylase/glucosamine-1-phosphate N-acetyltransferase
MRAGQVKVYLFDEGLTDQWHPFALTRPCGELRFGDRLLRERVEVFTGRPVTAALSRSWLTAFGEPGAPPVLDRDTDRREGSPDTRAGDRLFLSSRFVPSVGSRWSEPVAEGALLLHADGQPVGAWVPDGREAPRASWFRKPGELPGFGEIELAGARLSRVWDLIERNPDQLAADLAIGRSTPLPRGSHGIGEGPVFLAKGVTVEPGALFDTRHGGIRLDPGVEVRAGARLAGPLHAGPGSRLLGGSYECLAAGPLCYLRGEIEETIVIGHSNKAHDGFLGHAMLGRWVNLGALTTNSDLKNNYGPVRLGQPDGEIDTGLVKLGCLIGDHAKSAIGTMINTGTVVGAGANLFGDDRPPKWIPPFAWGHAPDAPVYARERFLDTAATVLARRGLEADSGVRAWLGACWDQARGGDPI